MANRMGVNKLAIVNADSRGVTIAFPDVCKTPTPGGPVPIPYPNIARSADTAKGSKKLRVDGKPICIASSCFSTSTGDEPGTAGGGVVSNKTKGKATFVSHSFDVKVEGKGVARSFDLMLHNQRNTPPFPVLQAPLIALPRRGGPPECLCCKKKL